MTNICVIRYRVATMANRLRKTGLTLSQAFKKAWEIVKNGGINSKVTGVTKGNRQKALYRISSKYNANDVTVWLERDKMNLYDVNAINVMISVKGSKAYNLGCIPKNLAYVLSYMLDKGIELKTSFMGVTGHFDNYTNYGAVLALEIA